jgi:hypothetical protein
MVVLQFNRGFHLFIIAGLLSATLAGCAAIAPLGTQEIEAAEPVAISAGKNWWGARFRIKWPRETEPRWYMGLLIADQIVRPGLDKYGDEIDLWRFHRRAARDNAGHLFSFIFYASPATATRIYAEIESNELLRDLTFAGLIEAATYDDTTEIAKPNIADSSDKKWSLAVQEAWPYYIMGVSQMWLQLSSDVAADISKGDQPASIPELEAVFQKADAVVTELWQKEGRHAFLHHLNAIFEYKPVVVWEKRLLKF